MARAARIVQWLSDHWPVTLIWPADIPRPAPAPGSPACPADAQAVLEAARAAYACVGPAMMAMDMEAMQAHEAEAFRLASTLGEDGQVLSPAAICEMLSVPRHVYDDVVRRYGAGGPRAGCAAREPKSCTGRMLALLRGCGDHRFASPRTKRAG